MEKSKLPLKAHDCDDFVVEDTETNEKYYPHAGEKIYYIKKTSLKDMTGLMKFQNLLARQQAENELEGASSETADEVANALANLIVLIESSIKKWDWTDNEGVPYQEKPIPEELVTLGVDEIIYLVSIIVGAAAAKAGDSDSKN